MPRAVVVPTELKKHGPSNRISRLAHGALTALLTVQYTLHDLFEVLIRRPGTLPLPSLGPRKLQATD